MTRPTSHTNIVSMYNVAGLMHRACFKRDENVKPVQLPPGRISTLAVDITQLLPRSQVEAHLTTAVITAARGGIGITDGTRTTHDPNRPVVEDSDEDAVVARREMAHQVGGPVAITTIPHHCRLPMRNAMKAMTARRTLSHLTAIVRVAHHTCLSDHEGTLKMLDYLVPM